MKISIRWLRELVEVDATAQEIAERLTAAGLEVEGESTLGGGLSGVIVAEVRGSRPHPNAAKLNLVDVWDGREVTQVVCGAPNVPPAGGKVIWARPGATLPRGITLAPKEVRGIVSPGMLCVEDELGLGSAHEGILILDPDAIPGADAATLLGLPDTILELNVTPNRPDALGHLGVAREVAALFSAPGRSSRPARLIPPDEDLAPFTGDEPVAGLAKVTLEDRAGCPRYTARVLTGVRVGQSPLATRLRLQALGVRAINDVVDATNLALLETGHPLHAFDLDRLDGSAIVVRRARPGEPIVTLDGQERRLTDDDVTICDGDPAGGRPVAVAGVMGGRDSEVHSGTTRILLESAYFDPAAIRRTSRRLGLKSEASIRFERGADPNRGLELASRGCARRIAQRTAARVASGLIDVYPARLEPRRVPLRPARTERLLGVSIPPAEQARILGALGLDSDGQGGWQVPTFRPDLTREIDLIEEIARVHGYDRIPATLPRGSGEVSAAASPPEGAPLEAVRDALAALGLCETVSFAFASPERLAALELRDRRARPLRLSNPLREEQSALRTSLVPGLLAALQRNLDHGVDAVRLFELGAIFLPSPAPGETALPDEPMMVAGILAGRREGWLKPGEDLDFFDVKGVVEGLLARLLAPDATYQPLEAGEAPWLHPGRSASVRSRAGAASDPIGVLGEVHADLRARLGVSAPAFAFELRVDGLLLGHPSYRESPRFPGSARDLSFFVAEEVAAAAVRAGILGASPLLESVRVLEDYREAGRVPPGKKGMLWSLGFRSRERTLTDEEVNREHARVVEALRAAFAIDPR